METVRIEDPDPPEVSGTLLGLREVVMLGLFGVTVAPSATVPEKPKLVRAIVDIPEFPATRLSMLGLALMVKSLVAKTTKLPTMMVGWTTQRYVYVPGAKLALKEYGVEDEKDIEHGSTAGQSELSAPSRSTSTRNWWRSVSTLVKLSETVSPCRTVIVGLGCVVVPFQPA